MSPSEFDTLSLHDALPISKSPSARRPTARTTRGSSPGSPSRPSRAEAGTVARSSTLSTASPITLSPTSSTSTLRSSVRDGRSRRREPSTTVRRSPRTLISPSTASVAPGIRVPRWKGTISLAVSTGTAQVRSPTRKTSRRSGAVSAIVSEEAKIAKALSVSNFRPLPPLRLGGQPEGLPEVGGPLAPEPEGLAADGVLEGELGGVQRLPLGGPFEGLGPGPGGAADAPAPPGTVDLVAHDRMADVGHMDPDLVGP